MELIEFLISMFFATLICGGIICIFMYLFYSRAGYKVLRFRIYCWEYCINPDGNSAKKYIIRKNAFKLAPDLSMYKPDADIDQELDIRLTCLSIMCMGAITVLFDLVCIYMAIQRCGFFIDSFPVMFMYTLSGTMTLYLISLIVIIISGKYGKKNELGNYLNHNIHQMMATGRITEPLLPPLESLGLKGNIHTCLQYQLVRFRQMQIIGDYAEINKIADYLENEMLTRWSNVNSTVEEINHTAQKLIDTNVISLKTLDDSSEDCLPLLKKSSSKLINLMRTNQVTGVFVVLNTDNLKEKKEKG